MSFLVLTVIGVLIGLPVFLTVDAHLKDVQGRDDKRTRPS